MTKTLRVDVCEQAALNETLKTAMDIGWTFFGFQVTQCAEAEAGGKVNVFQLEDCRVF